MKYPDSHFESKEAHRISHSRRMYDEMKKIGKEAWWKQNGPRSSYANFLGTKNYNELIEDFKTFATLEKKNG